MAIKSHMYHYIYKITCLRNNRYYIGMHSTSNLEDGYYGGGKIIKNSVKKYGKESRRKEILEFLEDREKLRNREIELVTEELVNDQMCMNINLGGDGGWLTEWQRKGAIKANQKNWKDQNFRDRMKTVSSSVMKTLWKDEDKSKKLLEGASKSFLGKKHSEETKSKIGMKSSKNQSGSKNSQFGKIWVYNEDFEKSKKIDKKDLKSFLDSGWKRGRKMNFSSSSSSIG